MTELAETRADPQSLTLLTGNCTHEPANCAESDSHLHSQAAEQWLSSDPVYQGLRSLVVSMDRIADASETRHQRPRSPES